MIRTSIAAALVLAAAATPSFAGPYGYDRPSSYGGGYGRAYDDDGYTNRLVVDSYTGRVTFGDAGEDHCVRERRFTRWSYSRRIVRPYSGYGAGYGSGYEY